MKQLVTLALIASTILVLQPMSTMAEDFNTFNGAGENFPSAPNPFAKENEIESDLLYVTSNAMQGYLMLKTVVDSSLSLQELKYVTSDNVILDMRLDDLAKGVVLMTSGKYEILKLVGHDLSPETGGILDLIYLSDGIWNIYKTFSMSLIRSGNQWSLQSRVKDQPGISFNSMYLEKRTTFWGQMIGLANITISQR